MFVLPIRFISVVTLDIFDGQGFQFWDRPTYSKYFDVKVFVERIDHNKCEAFH